MTGARVSEAEDLRAVLIELDRLRTRERMASRESETLLQVLDSMTQATSSDDAAQKLVQLCAATLHADAVVLVGLHGTDGLRVHVTTAPALEGLHWDQGMDFLARPRRMVDLFKRDWGGPLPEVLATYRALLATPLVMEGEPPLVLLALATQPAFFSAPDQHLLRRVAKMAGQALATLRVTRRNALLAGLIDGSVPVDRAMDGFLDAPFEAVSRAFDRLTKAQATVVSLNNALLRAPSETLDAAITDALARTGELAQADRDYVFRMRKSGNIDNTHEWTMPGIAPMIGHLQDMSGELMDPWRPTFEADKEVYIPDVKSLPDAELREILLEQGICSLLAVPMAQDGKLTGFLGYDAVREPRRFLPGEIFLLRSVGNTINAVLERRQADLRAEQATEALLDTTAMAVAARERLANAVEALKDGFALYDPDGRLVLCNQPYREGFPRSGHLIRAGMTYRDILELRIAHREYKSAIGRETDWLAERLSQHGQMQDEVEHELADGRWMRAFEKVTPDGGRVRLRVDITALKIAEKRALAERAAAMDASRDGIAITNAQGCYLYMNSAHRAMFGIPVDEDVSALHWSDLYDDEQVALLRRIAFPGMQHNGSWRGELKGLHRDGSAVDQEVSLTLQDGGGSVCISRDIAERRRAEAERTRLREALQLAQRREMIAQLAGGLAHDFNNILAVISGSAAIIEARHDTPDLQDARRIRQAARRATELVARLRDLGKHGGNRASIDLREPLNEAADLLRAGLSQEHRIIIEQPDRPLAVTADATDILQVLLNLAINARDALGPGTNEIVLSLGPADPAAMTRPPDIGDLRAGTSYVMLRVSDTGPGMENHVRAQVFEPYFTTKGSAGTGLGLAIVSGVVRGNHAALWLDSSPGNGTRALILWPVDPVDVRPAAMEIETDAKRLDGLCLLVVDDQEQVCDVLAAILEAAGAEVATATDPRDALSAIADNPQHWSALITDHDMPHLSGRELAQAARRHAPGLAVILVSALPETAADQTTLFNAVLGKPVEPLTLVTAVAQALSTGKVLDE